MVVSRFAVAIALTFGASFFAGCLSDVADDATGTLLGTAGVPDMFHMEATDCEEAGWVAMYGGLGQVHGIWDQVDVREEYGNPWKDSRGAPTPLIEEQWANIHLGWHCGTATVAGETVPDFTWGAILQLIAPPAFDVGGADRHMVISGMSFQNGSFADLLRVTTKAQITPTKYACTAWALSVETLPANTQDCPETVTGTETPRSMPRSYAYTVYHDAVKGNYQTWGTMAKYRDVPDRVTRLWWQVPADGSEMDIWHGFHAEVPEGTKWHPVYWDVFMAGGGQWTTPPEGILELGNHNLGIPTGEHGTPFNQPLQQVFYEHPTLTFTSGHVVTDVTLDDIWAH